MTQRNFQNARNQGDGPKGKSRKSASSAKIKSKAGASVYTPSKEAKAKAAAKASKSSRAKDDRSVEKKANDPIEQQRRRERAMVSMMRDLPEYKRWRRIWWITMAIAFVVIIATWIPNMLINSGQLSADFTETASWISTIGFIIALIALAAAFYIDFRKIRKIQKAQEAKARNLTKTERRELDDAIAASIERDQQRRAERKGKMPWGKKKTEASSEEASDES